jgi:hypothetical protein
MLRSVFSANFLSLGFISRIARRRRFTCGQIADAVVRSPQPKIDVMTGIDRGSSRRHMDQEFRASAKLLADSLLYARAVRG